MSRLNPRLDTILLNIVDLRDNSLDSMFEEWYSQGSDASQAVSALLTDCIQTVIHHTSYDPHSPYQLFFSCPKIEIIKKHYILSACMYHNIDYLYNRGIVVCHKPLPWWGKWIEVYRDKLHQLVKEHSTILKKENVEYLLLNDLPIFIDRLIVFMRAALYMRMATIQCPKNLELYFEKDKGTIIGI